jgi:hypothetical protein
MRIVIAALALMLTVGAVQAQAPGGNTGYREPFAHRNQEKPQVAPKSVANDKDYNAALKSIPDKPKADPWQVAR